MVLPVFPILFFYHGLYFKELMCSACTGSNCKIRTSREWKSLRSDAHGRNFKLTAGWTRKRDSRRDS